MEFTSLFFISAFLHAEFTGQSMPVGHFRPLSAFCYFWVRHELKYFHDFGSIFQHGQHSIVDDAQHALVHDDRGGAIQLGLVLSLFSFLSLFLYKF